MLIFIEKTDSDTNVRLELRRLKATYKSFEKLQNNILKTRCNSPEMLEDYMIWAALNQSDPTLIERFRISQEELFTYLTPRRMELLEYLGAHPLDSIKDLAEILERDYKNVYDDVLALEKFGLVEFIREGKNKCPVTKVTKISIFLNESM
jgi:DNA-binding MarR family transcriptional regulator